VATKVVSAIVVDDSDDMRSVISELVNRADQGVRIAATFGDPADAMAWCRIDPPDVVVLDLHLPGVAGLDVAAALLEQQPDLAIVVFSAFLHPAARAEAERIGVRACIDKQEVRRLPAALWEVARAASPPA
jgi:DNA-binding NarL/FixJ family response regulator